MIFLLFQVYRDLQKMSSQLECSEKHITKALQIFVSSIFTSYLCNTSHFVFSARTGHIHKKINSEFSCGENEQYLKVCECGVTHQHVGDDLYELGSLEEFFKTKQNLKMSAVNDSFETKGGNLFSKVDSSVLTEPDIVVDCCAVYESGIQTAVLSACSLLRIGQIMENL